MLGSRARQLAPLQIRRRRRSGAILSAWIAISAVNSNNLLKAGVGVLALILVLASPGAGAAGGAEATAAEEATGEGATGESRSDSLPRYVLEPIAVEGESARLLDEGLPVAVSVVDRAALSRPGVLALTDALRPLPGVRIARFGASGSFTAVSIRGTSNEQVLVLVDGQRRTTAQGGGVDLGAVDVTALERVEVLRGGASALYGPDALGGVVNLVTRPVLGGAARTSVRLEGGSSGTVLGALRHDGGRFWLRGHGLRTAGDFGYHDRGADRTRVNADARREGGAAGIRFGGAIRVTLDGSLESAEQGVPGTVEFPTPEARREDRGAALAAALALADPAGERGRLTFSARHQRDRRSYADPAHGIDDRHVNRSTTLDVRLDRPLVKNGSTIDGKSQVSARERRPAVHVTAGVELRRAELESTTDGDRERECAGFALRGRIERGPIHLAPAVRLDAASDLAPFLSPRIALGLDLPGGHRLRIAAGRAYRPPSFDDLFFPARGGAMGNPDLAPERAFEVEVGLERGLLGGRLAASFFRREIEDLIQWQPGADGRWRPHNVGLAVLRGAELEAILPLPRPAPSITASVSLLDARNRSGEPVVDGRRLPYRPGVEGHIQLVSPIARRLRLIAAWHGVGTSAVTAANTKWVPGHGTLDLAVERCFGSRLVGSLAVLNLTDVAAVDVRDYPLPGREWRLALNFAVTGEVME